MTLNLIGSNRVQEIFYFRYIIWRVIRFLYLNDTVCHFDGPIIFTACSSGKIKKNCWVFLKRMFMNHRVIISIIIRQLLYYSGLIVITGESNSFCFVNRSRWILDYTLFIVSIRIRVISNVPNKLTLCHYRYRSRLFL